MALFESYERRIKQINATLEKYGIASIEEAEKITKDAGLDVYHQIEGIQPICFENAKWAYTVGAAIAIKKDCRRAAESAKLLQGGGNRYIDRQSVQWLPFCLLAGKRQGSGRRGPDLQLCRGRRSSGERSDSGYWRNGLSSAWIRRSRQEEPVHSSNG